MGAKGKGPKRSGRGGGVKEAVAVIFRLVLITVPRETKKENTCCFHTSGAAADITHHAYSCIDRSVHNMRIPSALAVLFSGDLGGLESVFDFVCPVDAPQEPIPCRDRAAALHTVCLHSNTLRGFLRDDNTLTLNAI
jgi:hypothetical protein